MPKDKRLDALLESMNRVSSTPYCIYHEVGLEHGEKESTGYKQLDRTSTWVCKAPENLDLAKGGNPKPTKCFGNIQKCELED